MVINDVIPSFITALFVIGWVMNGNYTGYRTHIHNTYTIPIFGGTLNVDRVGDVVMVLCDRLGTTSNMTARAENVNIWTLNDYYRPRDDYHTFITPKDTSHEYSMLMMINTSGQILVYPLQTVEWGTFSCTYIAYQ